MLSTHPDSGRGVLNNPGRMHHPISKLTMKRKTIILPPAFTSSSIFPSPFPISKQDQRYLFPSYSQFTRSWKSFSRSGLKPNYLCPKTRVEEDIAPKRPWRLTPRLGLTQNEDGFDFRLQPVAIDPINDGKDFSSTTVGWFEKKLFADQVEFELWTEFESLARNMKARVSRLDANVLTKFKGRMNEYEERLNENPPNSETILNAALFPLYLGWEKILRALHPRNPPISIYPGWACGTVTFQEVFRKDGPPEYDENDVFAADECKIPDYALFEGKSAQYRDKHSFPIAAVELKGPLRPAGIMEEDNTEIARKFVSFLQDVFDDKVDDVYGVGRIISQGIVEALFTYSGCSLLYCHTWARAIYVSELTNEKVKLKISRAFLCNEEVSASLAVLTTLDYALNTVQRDGMNSKKNLHNLFRLYLASRRIGNNLERISQAKDAEMQKTKAGRKRNGGSKGNSMNMEDDQFITYDGSQMELEAQLYILGSGTKRGGGVLTKPKLSRTHWVEELEEDIVKRRIPLFYIYPGGWNSQGFREKLMGAIWKWDDPDVVEGVLKTAARVIGKGGSGLVKKGMYGNSQVAVKFWNRENPEQAPLIRNEAAIYSYIATYHPQIMGRALPRLVATGKHWWHGTVLITEEVGRNLVVAEDGSIRVGEYAVNEEDKRVIYRLAETYLRALHSCGICHGDVNLRNLRVERTFVRDGISNSNWKLWWIDLGTSYFAKDMRHFKGELGSLREEMKARLHV